MAGQARHGPAKLNPGAPRTTINTQFYERAPRSDKRAKRIYIMKPRRTVPVLNNMRWKPLYDKAVMLYCLGKDNKQITAATKLSSRTIDRIISSATGQQLIAKYRADSASKFKATHGDRLQQLTERAFDNIEHVLTNDDLRQSNPLAVFDRSVKFLEAQRGVPSTPAQPVTNNNTLVINNPVPSSLLDKVNQALLMIGSVNGPVRLPVEPGTTQKSIKGSREKGN